MGRVGVAKLLLQHGADTEVKNNNGDTPRAALEVDWELTRYLAGLLQIELDARQVEDGRVEIAGLFEQPSIGEGRERTDKSREESAGFFKAMASPIFAVPLFHHLWFLWFLCWLVLVFALYARLADWLQWQGPPKWLVLSPVRFLYLIPLTMIPQSLMGLVVPSFGPDTSLGLLPMPHILLYYALFFFFGALYFDCDDPDGRVGKWWWLALPVGLFIVFPLGLEFSTGAFGLRQEIFDPAMARGRGGGIAGDLRLDDDLWFHRLVPQTLHPRKQHHSLRVGFVVLAVRGARTADHWRSISRARLATCFRGKVLPSLARSHRPSIADLPISRPLHLAGPTAERSPRPSDELALHFHRR